MKCFFALSLDLKLSVEILSPPHNSSLGAYAMNRAAKTKQKTKDRMETAEGEGESKENREGGGSAERGGEQNGIN